MSPIHDEVAFVHVTATKHLVALAMSLVLVPASLVDASADVGLHAEALSL